MVSPCGFLIRACVHFLLIWGLYSVFKYSVHSYALVIRILSSILASLSHVSYARACTVPPHLSTSDIVNLDLESGPTKIETNYEGGLRYCSKCKCYKPDRTHHCSKCRRCIIRMDHHCPWLATCVGLPNHRYFVQFLVYVFLLCSVANCLSVQFFYDFITDQLYLETYLELNFVFFTFVGVWFFLFLAFFGSYTIYHVYKNITTLEALEPTYYRTSLPPKAWRYKHPPDTENLGNVYNINTRENFEQIMGKNRLAWILPLKTELPTNGLTFPVNNELLLLAEERAEKELSMIERARVRYA